ncbi:MAG: transposase, partial [Lacrimispora sphenoides]
YANPNKCDPLVVTKYIGRYLGRPVIATSRIDKYDGENVTLHYNKHEDNSYVEKTIPALEFIERLIQHIPDTRNQIKNLVSPFQEKNINFFFHLMNGVPAS